MTKDHLTIGDLLLLDNRHALTVRTAAHAAITAAQGVRGDKKGSADFVHVVMWTKRTAAQLAESTKTSGGIDFGSQAENLTSAELLAQSGLIEEISEASGRHGVRNHWLRRGGYQVWSVADAELGKAAADIARRWGSTGLIRYSQAEALSSVLPNNPHDAVAAGRMALQYVRDAETALPAWARLPEYERLESDLIATGAYGNAFCSQFVIACYQAAAGRLGRQPEGVTALHARVANVRDLHGALIDDRRFYNRFDIEIPPTPHDGQ